MFGGYCPRFHKIGQGNKAEGGPGELGEAWPPNQEALRADVPGLKVCRKNAIRRHARV
jgi:hypothetical protein